MNHETLQPFSSALSSPVQSCGHQPGHPAPINGEYGLSLNARTDKPRFALPDLQCPPLPPQPMLVAWVKDLYKLSDEESEKLKGRYDAVQWTRLERELQHLVLLGLVACLKVNGTNTNIAKLQVSLTSDINVLIETLRNHPSHILFRHSPRCTTYSSSRPSRSDILFPFALPLSFFLTFLAASA